MAYQDRAVGALKKVEALDMHFEYISLLQDYTINGNKVAFLTTRPVGRIDLRSPSCIVCQRELKASSVTIEAAG